VSKATSPNEMRKDAALESSSRSGMSSSSLTLMLVDRTPEEVEAPSQTEARTP